MATKRAMLALLACSGAAGGKLPTVTAHGMGDSCFNPGFKSVTAAVAKATGSYAVCIPTGDTQAQDTTRGFLYSMDASVDVFAKKIQADPQLKGGFNAAGFSQGNSLIRGYIHKYNDPPVKSWVSVHGTVMGVAGFPHCDPHKAPARVAAVGEEEAALGGFLSPLCRLVDEFLGALAYSTFTQNTLFQAGYFKDPTRMASSAYQTHSEIAQWNGEGATPSPASYKSNFVSVDRFAMIKANKDTMIYPREGEHWGYFAPGGFTDILPMNQTGVYLNDTFGLQTVHKAGKMVFNSTDGDHLQFTTEQLTWWVQNYFLA
eukprot:TRINITY_DN11255_c0_g1_i1.p1 TRINITY_DN11255_c0_g1~~TRINITY_DN11255_c0_g1_i1.p1  ORF type:complete len:316 (+),score=151.02 TRINITY_DN11255_c0_g1_i1:69-1016(+)